MGQAGTVGRGGGLPSSKTCALCLNSGLRTARCLCGDGLGCFHLYMFLKKISGAFIPKRLTDLHLRNMPQSSGRRDCTRLLGGFPGGSLGLLSHARSVPGPPVSQLCSCG